MSAINTAIILDRGDTPEHLDQSKPKGLTLFGGKPLISRQIDKLRQIGVKNIIVSSFKFSEEYEQFILNNKSDFPDINIYSTKERMPLGSGGAVKNTMLNTNTDTAIILSGNSFIDIDLEAFINFHFEHYFDNTICVTSKSNGKHNYSFETNNNALNKLIVGSPEKGKLLNAGVYILSIDLFNLTHLQSFSLSKEILPQLCDGSFGAYETDKKLLTLETESSYLDSLNEFKN